VIYRSRGRAGLIELLIPLSITVIILSIADLFLRGDLLPTLTPGALNAALMSSMAEAPPGAASRAFIAGALKLLIHQEITVIVQAITDLLRADRRWRIKVLIQREI